MTPRPPTALLIGLMALASHAEQLQYSFPASAADSASARVQYGIQATTNGSSRSSLRIDSEMVHFNLDTFSSEGQ